MQLKGGKVMKNSLKVVIGLLALVMIFAQAAYSDNPVTFDVTVSVAAEASIEVVGGGPVDFGIMGIGATAVSGNPITIKNNGSGGSQTYSLALANPSGWIAVITVPGFDEYRLCAAFDSDGTVTWDPASHALTTAAAASSATKFAGDQSGSGVGYNEERSLHLRIETPSATSSPSAKIIQGIISATVD